MNDRLNLRDTIPPASDDSSVVAAPIDALDRVTEERPRFILKAIASGASARPFLDELRSLVLAVVADRRLAPAHVVGQLVRESDLDVAAKLELLHQLVPCDRNWSSIWCSSFDVVKEVGWEPDSVAAQLLALAVTEARASTDVLRDWLQDEGSEGKRASRGNVAECLLIILGATEPDHVLAALAGVPSFRAEFILSHVCVGNPGPAVALARRCIEDGDLLRAGLALSQAADGESVHAEILELATTLASMPPQDVAGWCAHARALRALLKLPTVEARVWKWLEDLPADHERLLSTAVACRIQDDELAPLEVLEHWIRRPCERLRLDYVCRALGERMAVQTQPVGRVPLRIDLEWRLVQDIAQAWRQGAHVQAAARGVESALYERTDAEYRSMGIDDLALAVAAGDEFSRRALMYVAESDGVRGTAWAKRLRERVLEHATPEERVEFARVARIREGDRARRQ